MADGPTYESISQLNAYIDEIDSCYRESFYTPATVAENKHRVQTLLYQISQMSPIFSEERSRILDKSAFQHQLQSAYHRLEREMKNYDRNIKQQCRRQIQAIDPTIEISDEANLELMSQHLLISSRERSLHALEILREYNVELQELEKALIMLQQLFQEFAFQVYDQDQKLKTITTNVETAETNIHTAVIALEESTELKNDIRKKCCCIGTCGLCTILAGVGGAGLTAVSGMCIVQ